MSKTYHQPRQHVHIPRHKQVVEDYAPHDWRRDLIDLDETPNNDDGRILVEDGVHADAQTR